MYVIFFIVPVRGKTHSISGTSLFFFHVFFNWFSLVNPLFLDGRCHRHGQSNAVYVKCYYVPMSMESQILERRKRAKEGTAAATSNDDDTTIKFSHLYGDDSDDDA